MSIKLATMEALQAGAPEQVSGEQGSWHREVCDLECCSVHVWSRYSAHSVGLRTPRDWVHGVGLEARIAEGLRVRVFIGSRRAGIR